jgi:hypothetical protein
MIVFWAGGMYARLQINTEPTLLGAYTDAPHVGQLKAHLIDICPDLTPKSPPAWKGDLHPNILRGFLPVSAVKILRISPTTVNPN